MIKKPRLLSIGHSYVVSLNRSLLREVQERGNIDVTVVSPRFFSGDLRPIDMELEPEGSSLQVIGIEAYLTSQIHFFFYNQSQLKKIVQQDYDFYYLWEEPYILSGYQVASLLAKKNKIYSLFSNQNISKKYPFPFSYFEKKSIESCDSLWGCGPLVEETFRKKGYLQTNYKIVPYFVNTKRFKPFTDLEKKSAREKMHMPDVLTLGFMGRLTEEKGLPLLQKVIEKLIPQHQFQFLVLGAGPMEAELKKWAQQEKLKNRVFFQFAKHEEIPQILPTIDILLCPSQTRPFWREQFGRMIIEAFSSGVPVVASDSGEIPFVVGSAGRVLPEADELIWVQTLAELIVNKSMRDEMRERGLQRSEVFSIEAVAKLVEQNVLNALKQAR